MTWIAFIRHGRTIWNEQARIQGQTDTDLSPAGRNAVGAWVVPADLAGARWVASPLRRARNTAALLGATDPARVPALMEMDWGDWEGCTLNELRADPRWRMHEREALGLDFQPPGGESPRQVRERLQGWLREIPRDAPAVAVTHKGVIRAALSLATDWDMTRDPPVKLRWDCAHRFTLGDNGILALAELNIPLTD